jgi:putative addiction module CopG family antidote
MVISLPPELERLVQERLQSGRYKTAAEVVSEGLRLLKERECITSEADYEQNKRRFLERMKNAPDLGTKGVISWTRDEIHER